MTIHRLTVYKRITVTDRAITLPTSRWLSGETAIALAEIESLSETDAYGQRFLYIYRYDRMRFTVAASLMPSNDAFDELRDLLRQALERGREPQ
ncbi:MAG: hypothetical protein DWQ31_08370 [Planctomycetota bacterium]|nr:MAG: hypothetical protein DWQ31_08370 [Planctomycetota bacterium]REJ93957.1 MAG: hypothetical protein DWQ35_09305 [Planctomycetota bacterium]REK30937.1 MAG: hypothetical protein DWQ42_01130 [Planctomycetota bacterium]REK38189.1 MAG: hypothetical protein DWQ46_20865 [Planctomycetota bacterium]